MERIKQAIAKAKAQAPQTAGLTSPAPVADIAPVAHAPQVTNVTNTPTTVELDTLRYAQTKIVPLRADHLERNRIVAHDKNSPMAWAFDLLRTHVLKAMDDNGWRTLAITSPTPEAGKTVVSINLAMSIAQHTTKTALLVDFDLRRPKVASYLGITPDISLNQVLAGTAEVSDAMINPSIPRFVVLPTRKPVPQAAEVLSAPRVANLVADLRARYESRIILFDLPPILSADDALVLLPKIDCVLLVVGNGMNSKKEIEDSLHHIPEAKLIGTVLNKADAEPRAYYY
jgi:capsular exopolysaccharide synthesis family protein